MQIGSLVHQFISSLVPVEVRKQDENFISFSHFLFHSAAPGIML